MFHGKWEKKSSFFDSKSLFHENVTKVCISKPLKVRHQTSKSTIWGQKVWKEKINFLEKLEKETILKILGWSKIRNKENI